MNKEELVKIVAEKSNMTQKDAHEILGATIDVITAALSKSEKVTLVGFGTFQVRERAAREGRNPRTGAVLHIASKKRPAFAPGKLLKERVMAARHPVGAGRKR